MDEIAIDPDGVADIVPIDYVGGGRARAAARPRAPAAPSRSSPATSAPTQRRADRARVPPVRPRAAADRRRRRPRGSRTPSSTFPTSGSRRASTTRRARELLVPARARVAAAARLLRDADRLRRARALGQGHDHARRPRPPRSPDRGTSRLTPASRALASGRLVCKYAGVTDMRIDRLRSRHRRARQPAGLPRAARRDHLRRSSPPASASPRTSSPSASPSAARRCARR